MELIIERIYGRFRDYSKVTIGEGYCFYDKDAEDIVYMNNIATPILDESILRAKFIVVQGNAEQLNDELAKEMEQNGR